MIVCPPLVEAEQDGSIRIQDLTKVVMGRRRLGLAKERLVPFEAARDVAYANDRPCALHRISAVGLTIVRLRTSPRILRIFPSTANSADSYVPQGPKLDTPRPLGSACLPLISGSLAKSWRGYPG